jgi:hypothetical protein
MGLFRVTHCNFEEILTMENFDTTDVNEWLGTERLNEPAWVARYEYEASLIDDVIKNNPNIKSILEIGSGPGVLSQKVLNAHPNIEYHLVDKPFAKKYFDDNNFKGKFFVKDLSSSFDKSELNEKYDLVIANDFLEHVFNPHAILKAIVELTHSNSLLFISNPNWRMAHQYIYRGLFDFDNFIYFFYIHHFNLDGFYGSPLKTTFYPRRDSETLLPDEHLTDWNHYLVFRRKQI